MKPLTYREYLERLQDVCVAKGLPIDYVGTVSTGDYFRTTYPLYRVMIRRPSDHQAPVCYVSGVHGDEPAGVRLVRAEDRTKGAGANLVQDPKRPECVRWRGAGSVRMQRRYSSGNREDGTTETSAVQSFSRVTVGAR